MKVSISILAGSLAAFVLLPLFPLLSVKPQNSNFHNAPASAKQLKNPYAGRPGDTEAGQKLYVHNCASCHGKQAEGTGNVPPLVGRALQSVTFGELFWFITRGDQDNGMPSWSKLP